MGNPVIHGLEFPGHMPDVPPPPRVRLHWTVYKLRYRGLQLTPEQILKTGQQGELQFDGSIAWLKDPSTIYRFTVASLDGVSDVRLEGSGILIFGQETVTMRGGGRVDVPQAWWCLLAAAVPIETASSEAQKQKNSPLQPEGHRGE